MVVKENVVEIEGTLPEEGVHVQGNTGDVPDLKAEIAEEEADPVQDHHDTTNSAVIRDVVNLLYIGMYLLPVSNTSLRFSTKLCRLPDKFPLIS